MGVRVINNIVDITNYLMFDMGQPMHAFDADKIVGGIEVRSARTGESFVSLSGEEVNLTEQDLVIADQEGVLEPGGDEGRRTRRREARAGAPAGGRRCARARGVPRATNLCAACVAVM